MMTLMDNTTLQALARCLDRRAGGEGDARTLLDVALNVVLAERFLWSTNERNYIRDESRATIERLGAEIDPAYQGLFAACEPTEEHMAEACARAAGDLEDWLGLIGAGAARWPDIPEHANRPDPQALLSNLELNDFLSGGYRDEAYLEELREFGLLRRNELTPAVALAGSERALGLLAGIQAKSGWNERRTAILEQFVRTQVYRYLPHIVGVPADDGGAGAVVYWPSDFRKRSVLVPAMGLVESLAAGGNARGGESLAARRFATSGVLDALLLGGRAEPAAILAIALELREAMAPLRQALGDAGPLQRAEPLAEALAAAPPSPLAAPVGVWRKGPPSELRVVDMLLPPCKLPRSARAAANGLPPAFQAVAERSRRTPKSAVALQRFETDGEPAEVEASAYKTLLANCIAA